MDELIHEALSTKRVSNAWGSPRGTQMPTPLAAGKFVIPHPGGMTKWASASQLPEGVGGIGIAGIDWCIIGINKNLRSFFKTQVRIPYAALLVP